jgi:hypothetical protein
MKAKIFLSLMALLFVMPMGLAWSEGPSIAGRCEEAHILAQESIEPATPTVTVEGGISIPPIIWDDMIGFELDDDDINSIL